MNTARLVWQRTGDEILFFPCDYELLEYYIDQLEAYQCQHFRFAETTFDPDKVESLKNSLAVIETYQTRLPTSVTDFRGDVFDQQYLNTLHRQWVTALQSAPKLPVLLDRMGILHHWQQINHDLHSIEENWDFVFFNYDQYPLEIPNPHQTIASVWKDTQIYMGYDNLGRCSYTKWLNWDDDSYSRDTHTHETLSGMIHINLQRSGTHSPPREYVEWCQRYQQPLSHKYGLPLGEIENMHEKLTDLRHVIVRNISVEDNHLCLTL